MNINEAALCLVCLLNVPSHQDGAGLGGALPQRPHGHAILRSPGSFPVWGSPWGARGTSITVSNSREGFLPLDKVGAMTVC